MKKKELLKLRTLNATSKMMQMADADVPQRTVYKSWNGEQVYLSYEYSLYMRCQVVHGFLKVAFFLPEHMRAGGKKAAYELYIDKEKGEFITYDRIRQKWLTAKVDMLPWPGYIYGSKNKWISPQGHDRIKKYLGGEHGGYQGLLEYQLKVRAEELKRRHKRETDPWDLEMAQTPKLPKDWKRWVDKVGIRENYIFYQYSKKGAKTGYCTFCEKEVAVSKPRHNKTGRCMRCRHKITYKSIGRAGTVVTEDAKMYLMQRCEDGFILREFNGYRRYRKGDYKNPEVSSWEIRRAIYDHNANPINAYYWGLYKLAETRWIRTSFCVPNWYGDGRGRVYGKTLPTLGARELRRTGMIETLQDRQKIDPEKYLAVYERIPQLEQLAKAHLSVLVTECMRDYYNFEKAFKNPQSGSLLKQIGRAHV